MENLFKKIFKPRVELTPEPKIISLKENLKQFFGLAKKCWKFVLGIPLLIALSAQIVFWSITALLSITLANSGTYPNTASFIIMFVGIILLAGIIIIATILVAGLIKWLGNQIEKPSLKLFFKTGRSSTWKLWRVILLNFMVLLLMFGLPIFGMITTALDDPSNLVTAEGIGEAVGQGVATPLGLVNGDNSIMLVSILVLICCIPIYILWYFVSGVFGLFIAVTENRKGHESIKRSRELTRRHWWLTWSRALVFKLLMLIPFIIFFILCIVVVEAGGQLLGLFVVDFCVWLFVVLFVLFFWPFFQSMRISRPAESKVKSRENWVGIVIAGLILIIIFLAQQTFVLLNNSVKDLSTVNDESLKIETSIIPKEENALFAFFNGVDFSEDREVFLKSYENWNKSTDLAGYKEDITLIKSYIDGKEWNLEKAKVMVETNNKLLSSFDESVKLNKFQSPYTASCDNPNAGNVPLGTLRSVARHVSVRSLIYAHQGETNLAINDAVNLIKFGQMVGEDNALISNLVGVVIKDMGFKVLNQDLQILNFTQKELQNIAIEIDDYADALHFFERGYKCEYKVSNFYFAEINEKMAKNNLKYYYQPKMCQQKRADSWMKIITKNYTKDPVVRQEISNKLDVSYAMEGFNLGIFYHKNFICDILQTLATLTMESATNKALVTNYHYLETKINIASLLYQKENQKMPETLADLVPEYLDTLPIDPMNNQPVHYDKDKGIIYSVGVNLIDEQGAGDDLVLKLANKLKK